MGLWSVLASILLMLLNVVLSAWLALGLHNSILVSTAR